MLVEREHAILFRDVSLLDLQEEEIPPGIKLIAIKVSVSRSYDIPVDFIIPSWDRASMENPPESRANL